MNNYYLKHLLQHKKLKIHIEHGCLNGQFDTHRHNFCELTFIQSGKGIHVVGDREYELKKGDIYIIKGNESHGYTNLNHMEYFNIMFNIYDLRIEDSKNLPGFWALFVHEQTSEFASHINVSEGDYDKVLTWCQQLLSEYTEMEPGYIDICHSILLQLVAFLSRKHASYDNFAPQMDLRIANTIVFMQTNFSEIITVDKLAEMAGFSKRHFSRLFQQSYGVSPMHFLNEIRLNYATFLLETENYKITEIASLCGFQDGNYFSKYFKERFHVSPSKWNTKAKEIP